MSTKVEKVQFQAPAARAGQATLVEQSRAVAEVQAAVVVAQQIPRVTADALAEMRESCAQPGLADRAFFRFPRGGSMVSGPSVHLARELARCWRNVQYGVSEMRRDDREGVSEMQAWAWDVQTNTRSSHTFIVPHKRDKRGGAEALTDLRDIYENNANQGARRLREAIFNVLPPWFTEEAQSLCHATLEHGGGKPLAQRIADCIAMFDELGVTVADLEKSVGRKQADWTAHDVSQLGVSFKSVHRGEVSVGELFPREQRAVSVAEIKEQAAAASTPDVPEVETVPDVPEAEQSEAPASDETRAAAKTAKAAARDAGNASALSAALKAEGIPSTESKWTEAQARQVVEIAEGLS